MTKQRRELNKDIDFQEQLVHHLNRTISGLKAELRREKAILQFLLRKPKPKPDRVV
jgi:uncharacterized coiled-coil protein SlyX